MLKAMLKTGYDAVNTTARDFYFLSQVDTGTTTLPFISANIYNERADRPWMKPYLIKKSGLASIGITGIVSPASFERYLPDLAENDIHITVKSPQEALDKVLPRLQKDADIIVVMAALPKEDAKELFESRPEVDIVINMHGPTMQQENRLFCSTDGCADGLGRIDIAFDRKTPTHLTHLMLELDDSVDPNLDLWRMIEENYFVARMQRKNATKKQVLELTPEEFMQQMQ